MQKRRSFHKGFHKCSDLKMTVTQIDHSNWLTVQEQTTDRWTGAPQMQPSSSRWQPTQFAHCHCEWVPSSSIDLSISTPHWKRFPAVPRIIIRISVFHSRLKHSIISVDEMIHSSARRAWYYLTTEVEQRYSETGNPRTPAVQSINKVCAWNTSTVMQKPHYKMNPVKPQQHAFSQDKDRSS